MRTRTSGNYHIGTGLFLALALSLTFVLEGTAAEFRFVAGQVSDNQSVWSPGVTLIEQEEVKDGKVFFVLNNPTKLDHVFAVHGLLEYVPQKVTEWVDLGLPEEGMSYILKPIFVKVGPNETKRIQVNPRQIQGHHAIGSKFRVFCTIHKDLHVASAIFVTN
jgi:hypothetical protein